MFATVIDSHKFTSAVHAAIAEAAIDLCSGRGLPFGGGDISVVLPYSRSVIAFPESQN